MDGAGNQREGATNGQAGCLRSKNQRRQSTKTGEEKEGGNTNAEDKRKRGQRRGKDKRAKEAKRRGRNERGMTATRGKNVAGSTREIPRSSRFEGVGFGPRLSRVRLPQNFMCRPYVLNRPHPAVLGQLDTLRSDDFGRLAPPSKRQVPPALLAPATD